MIGDPLSGLPHARQFSAWIYSRTFGSALTTHADSALRYRLRSWASYLWVGRGVAGECRLDGTYLPFFHNIFFKKFPNRTNSIQMSFEKNVMKKNLEYFLG